ncbi:MAG TPA: hypothetical protein VNV82_13140 [Bryobacteraceae bacterium]|jgi:hypothetical protein|nr:hypothetical protein [Bryobacteraceae bacterium]
MKLPPKIAEFFRKQGSKGGKKAAKLLTDEQRRNRAKKASTRAAEIMTPEQRIARAKKAVEAREAKRKARKGHA